MRRRNIRYKPSKPQAAMGLAVGILFVILGITMVIPMTFRAGFAPVGLFGLAWTGIAVYSTVINAKYLFGSKDGKNENLFGGYEVTEEPADEPTPAFRTDAPDRRHITGAGLDAKGRLEQLETLKSAGLLTQEEYSQKRKEILKEL